MTRSSAPAPVPAPRQQKTLSLLERIAAASAAFGNLTKDSKNDYLKSQYLGLPGLLKAIKQPLLEQGVVIYTQLMVRDGIHVVLTTLSSIDGEEELSSAFPIFDMSSMHKIGAAVTYGTRYNLLALLAVCPDNDDDASSAVYGGATMAPTALPGMAPPVQMQQPAPQVMPPAMVNPVQPTPVLQ